jgi:VWFA-related protein
MSIKKTVLFPLLLTTLLAWETFAQDVVRIETNLVTLNVAVTDKTGNYVQGLGKEQFVILDNGRKQGIDSFSAIYAPVSLGIVYDMRPTTDEQTQSVLQALRQFTQKLKSDDQFFVNVFGERGNLTTDFVPGDEQVRDWVQNGDRKGPNSLYDAIFAASNKVARMKNPKKILIVLTDGQDHTSQHSYKELRIHLRTINLPVYSVTFGNDDRRLFSYADINRNGPRQTFGADEASGLDRSMLAGISKTTGGQSFEGTLRNRYYLTALCAKVMAEINNQYLIGFYPSEDDGKWHKLSVSVAGKPGAKYNLSSRRGYQSKKR